MSGTEEEVSDFYLLLGDEVALKRVRCFSEASQAAVSTRDQEPFNIHVLMALIKKEGVKLRSGLTLGEYQVLVRDVSAAWGRAATRISACGQRYWTPACDEALRLLLRHHKNPPVPAGLEVSRNPTESMKVGGREIRIPFFLAELLYLKLEEKERKDFLHLLWWQACRVVQQESQRLTERQQRLAVSNRALRHHFGVILDREIEVSIQKGLEERGIQKKT